MKAASEYEVYAIGAERDQAAALGESGSSAVTSFYGHARFEVQEVMRRVRDGEAGGERIGQIQFVLPSPIFPPEKVLELETLLKLLSNGEIDPNIAKGKP